MPLLPRPRARRPAAVIAAPPAMRVPRPAAWWILPVIVLVGAAVVGTLWWLLVDPAVTVPAPGPSGPSGAGTARGETLRTALAAGAGVGAAVTLMLAFRRQRHQEIATAHATHDATERRVTELYTKAVEQLGSDKAAVRLGGLYALERLAQDNPGHRQTIVNVICAYLRMPYTPPEPTPAPDPEGDRKAALRAAWRRYQTVRAGVPLPAEPAPQQESGDREGELQVRLTAQRILADHLRDDQRSTLPAAPAFWEGMNLDLTGATLIDFDLTSGHVTTAIFDKATFIETARFSKATFTETAEFNGATFTETAEFNGATFTGTAEFNGAAFTEVARFGEATFTRYVEFNGATFTRYVEFDGATFTEGAEFGEATFTRSVKFDGATFTGAVWFTSATFSENAEFGEATFTRYVEFNGATCTGIAHFDGATFTGVAGFDGVTFISGARFNGATVANPAERHSWPDGWRVTVTPEGTGRLVREEADGVPAGED